MRFVASIIAERRETAKVLEQYLRLKVPECVESKWFTYGEQRITRDLVAGTDIFIHDLFSTDTQGLYAAGIFSAEYWLSIGKRVLLVAGTACAVDFGCPLFWDLSSQEPLSGRINDLVSSSPGTNQMLDDLKQHFSRDYRKPEDPHDREKVPCG